MSQIWDHISPYLYLNTSQRWQNLQNFVCTYIYIYISLHICSYLPQKTLCLLLRNCLSFNYLLILMNVIDLPQYIVYAGFFFPMFFIHVSLRQNIFLCWRTSKKLKYFMLNNLQLMSWTHLDMSYSFYCFCCLKCNKLLLKIFLNIFKISVKTFFSQ